jgi:hypothetical protein
MARRRARSNSVADSAFLKDILSLKYLSCEAPICGHFASHDAASLCGGRALQAFTLNPVWQAGTMSACSGALAFVIECRAEKEFTELRSCS